MNVQLAQTEATPLLSPKNPPLCMVIEKVHDHDPKPRLLPSTGSVPGRKNTFTKECICGACLLDHIKAQMVEADFIKCHLMSARCKKESLMYRKNCTCSAASMRKLQYKPLS